MYYTVEHKGFIVGSKCGTLLCEVGSFVREKKREKKFKECMKIFLGSEHFRSLHGGHLGQCEFSSKPMQEV
jgi:hypothetical protein